MSDQDIQNERETPHRTDPEMPETEAALVASRAEQYAPGYVAGEVDEEAFAREGREASLWADAWRQLRRNPVFVVAIGLIVVFTLMAVVPQLFTSFYPGNPDPRSCNLADSLIRPNATQWFGTDLQGCDYYAKTVYGARVSMIIGVTVVGFAGMIALLFGSVSGYYGGKIDTLVSRITDVWFALPLILGAIVLLSVVGHSLFWVSFVLVVFGWPVMLRLMRSSVLEIKEEDYVDAARALGASDWRILTRHILPNGIAPVVVYATLYVGLVISAEATLSFLGVGLQLPAISWGLMINESLNRFRNAPHLLLFPGGFLFMTVLGFVLMGDALRDALDPKLQPR